MMQNVSNSNDKNFITKKELMYKLEYLNHDSINAMKKRLSRKKEFVSQLLQLRQDNHLFGETNKYSKKIPMDEVQLILQYI